MESLAKGQGNRALGPMDQAECSWMRWKDNLLPGNLAVAARAFSLHIDLSVEHKRWLFLEKKPLCCMDSVNTRIENAVGRLAHPEIIEA
jgi:hypothetical protein